MTPVRAVLFDKDGTLFDFRASWLAAYRGAAAELAAIAGGGPPLAERLLARLGYDAARDSFEDSSPLLWAATHDLARRFADLEELAGVPDAGSRVLAHLADHATYPPVPVTDLPSLFGRLRARGLRLGIATMDVAAAAEASLDAFGLRGLVDFVAGCDSGHGLKPGPGMAQAFCRATGVPARALAVVGDTTADLAMARAAGARLALAVLTGATPPALLAAHADHVLASIAELEAVLDGQPPDEEP